MIIFKILKWLKRGVYALIAIGVAAAAVSLSGCGEYTPHVPADETEQVQEQPGELQSPENDVTT